MPSESPKASVAETLAHKIAAIKPGGLPAATTRKCEDLLIDVVGLCVTARNEDYIKSALAGCDDDGPCTAIGHARTLNAAGAAFVNGTAAHGEDFDDTFEGGPVHAGTVFEGVHGLFQGFAHTAKGDYDALIGDFGTRWVTDTLAFKPYPCGTMAQPYIDCARRLAARGIKAEDIAEIICEVAEGTVHRLWEPLADKQRPANGYAAKFATPYLLATGFVHGGVGLGAFTATAIRDARVLALAAKVKFVIDPDNPYPNNYTGHLRATMNDGSVVEERQPYLRGGAQEPLTRQDVTDKFLLNAQHGGWDAAQADGALKLLAGLFQGKINLSALRS